MAKDNLDKFELFYQEIPVSQDYLVENEIEDMVDHSESPKKKGLNADQVSLLARDALASSDRPQRKKANRPKETDLSNDRLTQSLF